jgi:YD repeat-containing protein
MNMITRGGETKYQYDHLGRLLSLTDPVGNPTSYEYDSQKHVVKETNALDKSRYFEYLGQWLIGQVQAKLAR